MISYELASKLKDKGFPQPKGEFCHYIGDSYLPSFVEIVNWIGDEFDYIKRISSNEWIAFSKDKTTERGFDHEEAAARLAIRIK